MIYFIEAAGTGLIKIGYVKDNPDKRLAVLQIGSPVKLRGLGLMVGEKEKERSVHERFRNDHSHGEWFRNSFALRMFIESHAGAWVPGKTHQFLSDLQKAQKAEAKAAIQAQCQETIEIVSRARAARNSFDLKKLRESLDSPKP